MFRTVKLNNRLVCSRATCNSSLQAERVHGSAFSDKTKHLRILVPILKCTAFISFITPRTLSVELRYILHTLYSSSSVSRNCNKSSALNTTLSNIRTTYYFYSFSLMTCLALQIRITLPMLNFVTSDNFTKVIFTFKVPRCSMVRA
jgi:hypothetical protein